MRGKVRAGTRFALACLILLGHAAAHARETRGLGREVTVTSARAWDRDVAADGLGLPEGSGNASRGGAAFAARCAQCHANGRGLQSIAQRWPYATTLFDYIRRAMPPDRARPLSADEVYALTAFVLSAENVIEPATVLNRESLPKVRMPGKAGFVRDDGGEMP